MSELLQLDAVDVVAAIRSGALKARDYLESCLQAAADQADLGAFIVLAKDSARPAADAVDRAVADGLPLPSLAGLPIAVKDNIDLAGLPTTGATPALRDARPFRTAPVLHKLLDAGAIPVGKTNLHELALGFTTVNQAPFAGTARNPYSLERTAGGSSGGTGAALAARILPAGLGTDTGGSVRVPAALCGLVGLRPSVGDGAERSAAGGAGRRYSSRGVLPISATFDTVGPMARSVADVALLDSVITGSEPSAPASLGGARLGVPKFFWSDLDPDTQAVADAALRALEDVGAVLVAVDVAQFEELGHGVFLPILVHDLPRDLREYLVDSAIADVTFEGVLAQAGNPEVREILQLAASGADVGQYEAAVRTHRPRLQELYQECLVANGLAALVMPTTVRPAVLIDSIGHDTNDQVTLYGRNTALASCVGAPGLSLHAGMTPDGLPVGLELDGPVGGDRGLLALGLAVENVLSRAPAPIMRR